MQVEQALFTSVDSGSMKGYQLVARSPGIDRRLAQQLCRWAPSHASLWGPDADDWSLNYFPAGDDWVAITRTVYGGPEYSSRGGMQVVTAMLALREPQLAEYQCDPLAVAQTALALGHLRLATEAAERLPTVSLPDVPIVPCGASPASQRPCAEPLAEIRDLLLDDRRVAIVGSRDPNAAVAELIGRMPVGRRLEISFTTGLRPSLRRSFRLHFLPPPDASMRRNLESQGILCVPAP